jgi:hypothetical protein
MSKRPGSHRFPKKKKSNKTLFYIDSALLGALLVFSFLFFCDRYANYIDISDEGFLAHGAARVLEGQIPNKDFFSLQPPLSFYTTACAFKLLGTSVHSMRVLGFTLHLIGIGLTYLICRRFAKPMASLISTLPAIFIGLPFFAFVPFAVWQGIVFSLGSMFFFLGYLSHRKSLSLFLSGLATGLAIISRHDQGFYSVLAITICILVLFFRQGSQTRIPLLKTICHWLGGVLLLIIPFVLWAAWNGSIHSMVEQLILFPFKTYGRTSAIPAPRFDLSQDFAYNAFATFFYLPGLVSLSVVLICIIRGFRKNAADFPIKHFYISFFSLSFYLQAVTRSDLNHLIITLPPFFVLLGIVLLTAFQYFAGVINRRVRSLSESAEDASAFMVYGVYILLFFTVFAGCKDRLMSPTPIGIKKISLPRAGVFADEDKSRAIETVVGIIQKYSGKDQSILCLPYEPMFYFLAERRNPTRWNYLWPGDQSEADHLKLIEEAKSDAPALVLLFNRENLRTYAPSIVRYVESDYYLSSEEAGIPLFLPKSKK